MKISKSRLVRLINETLAEGNPYEPEEMYPYKGPQSAQSEYFTGEDSPEDEKAQKLGALADLIAELMDLRVSEEEIITAVLDVTNTFVKGDYFPARDNSQD
jgi:hypothetical protein